MEVVSEMEINALRQISGLISHGRSVEDLDLSE